MNTELLQTIVGAILAANVLNRVVVNPLLNKIMTTTKLSGGETASSRDSNLVRAPISNEEITNRTEDNHNTHMVHCTSNVVKIPKFESNKTIDIFFKWLTIQFRDKKISINERRSNAYIVNQQLVLVSPCIFTEFIKSSAGCEYFSHLDKDWESKSNREKVRHIQNEFFKTNVHVRSVFSDDILKFSVKTKVKSKRSDRKKVRGILLKPDMTNYLLNGQRRRNSKALILKTPILA